MLLNISLWSNNFVIGIIPGLGDARAALASAIPCCQKHNNMKMKAHLLVAYHYVFLIKKMFAVLFIDLITCSELFILS